MRAVEIKAAVHITGDAYLKFERLAMFSNGIGFRFERFEPQPIFGIIQRAALDLGGMITDGEMFKTFNMGWGFAVVIEKGNLDETVNLAKEEGVQAELIGHITKTEGIKILYEGKKITLR
jgi:phosphoribosylformylglycinamidine cyclo-ligase